MIKLSRLQRIPHLKINVTNLRRIILYICTFSISIEWILNLISSGYRGISLNWMVIPILMLIDFSLDPSRYFKLRVLKWFILLFLPLIIFYISNNSSYGLPSYMTRLNLIKAGISSIIIFIFYMVNSKTSKNRRAIIFALLSGAMCAVIFQFVIMLLGFLQGRLVYSHLKYINVDLFRIGVAGDPNQSIIYILSSVAFISYIHFTYRMRNYTLLSYMLAIIAIIFTASTASRVGMIATFSVIFISFFLSWSVIPKHSKVIFIFLIIVSVVILFLCSSTSLVKFLEAGLISRWQYAIKVSDDSLNHRVMIYKWLAKKVLAEMHLIGLGYNIYYQEIGYKIPGGEYAVRWPHASFADAFIIGGLPFFFLYLYIWIVSIRSLWKMFNKNELNQIKRETAFFLCLLIGLFIVSLSLSVLWIKVTWTVLGVSFGCRSIKN